jgi:hypothetical protein
LVATVTLHLLFFCWLMTVVPQWRIIWWVVLIPVEYVAVRELLSSVLRGPDRP